MVVLVICKVTKLNHKEIDLYEKLEYSRYLTDIQSVFLSINEY